MTKRTKLEADRYAGVEHACQVRVSACARDKCKCGQVFIDLLDCDGEIFAVAPFDAETAVGIAELLINAGRGAS